MTDNHETRDDGESEETVRVDVGSTPDADQAADPDPESKPEDEAQAQPPVQPDSDQGPVGEPIEPGEEEDLRYPMEFYASHPEDWTLEQIATADVTPEVRAELLQSNEELLKTVETAGYDVEEWAVNPDASLGSDGSGSESDTTTPETEAETESESGEINVDAVVEAITGSARTRPTVKEVKTAYARDEITDAEMDAAMGVAVREEGASDDADLEPEDVELDPTREEAGLLDEDDQFSWEGEEIAEASQIGERVEHKFTFKETPFEVTEPEQMDDLERPIRQLQNFQQLEEGRQKAKARKFRREFADECLTVKGTPHYDVYLVDHPDPERGKSIVADPDGEHGLENRSWATPIFDAMNWYDKFKIGQRMSEEILGERKFQDRYD